MKNIKGAIFDIDGTVIDSMQTWDEVSEAFLKMRDITPPADLNDMLRELGGYDIPLYFKDEFNISDSTEKIAMILGEMIRNRMEFHTPLKEGAAQVLAMLKGQGIRICAATASERDYVVPALRRLGVIDYFERVFTCYEEATSKNCPEIYITSACFLETNISDTLVFEDALYAIKSAKRAGFPVVGLYDFSSDSQQDEIKDWSDFYYTSLLDFEKDFRKLRG